MIFTFYSYKGGVGRSMALANMAELFYRAGLNVLMIDWDLESPGLETFFFDAAQMDDILSQLGLMDMLLTYKEQMTQPWLVTEGEVLQLPEPEEFVTKIRSGGAGAGNLCLLTAGDRSAENFAEYAQSVITFDWQDFYQNWEGERYIEWLRQQLEQRYDVILIDSRTGVTEMGGICTYHLADVITMFCAPNKQNLYGTVNMAQKFTDPIWPTLRQQRPLKVLIVPSRIERAESNFLDNFQQEFISRFEAFVPHEEGIDIKQLWELAIPYIPKYVYQETIAVRESDLASAEDLATAYRELWEVLDRLRLSQPPFNTIDNRAGFSSSGKTRVQRDVFVSGSKNEYHGTVAFVEHNRGLLIEPILERERSMIQALYVAPPAYQQVRQQLSTQNAFILHGAAQTGKRTTALHLLLQQYGEQCFEITPYVDWECLQLSELKPNTGYLIDGVSADHAHKLTSFALRRLNRMLGALSSHLIITIDSEVMLKDNLRYHVVEWHEMPEPTHLLTQHLNWALPTPAQRERAYQLCQRRELLQILSTRPGPTDIQRLVELLAKVVLFEDFTFQQALEAYYS